MKRLFIFFFMMCWGPMIAQAQPVDMPAAVPDSVSTQQLAAEVARLSKRADTWDRVLSHLPQFHGYLQAGYEGATGSSTFLVKSVRVWMTGNLSPKLDYMMQMELVSPRLLDAFIRYKPLDALNLQVGEFKLPFTIENTEYTPLNFEFIDYPISLCRLGGFSDVCGVSASGRDLGAMISGRFFKRGDRHILSYDLGVFNGEGVNVWDRNKSKDVVSRIMVRPVRGLTIAGYYYWGEYGPDYLKRIRYGGGVCYDRGRVVARGEYIGGTTGVETVSSWVTVKEIESEGLYLMAGFRPVKGLMVAARYDTFLEDNSNSDSRQSNYTVGLTWEPVKYLRCQLNYTYEDFSIDDSKNRNVIAVMFTGIF